MFSVSRGRLELPRGRTLRGEAPVAAAVREALEETGWMCDPGPLVAVQRRRKRSGGGVRAMFLMRALDGSFEPSREISALVWADLRSARRLVCADDRRVLRAAEKQLRADVKAAVNEQTDPVAGSV